jgi:Fe-S-cluster containining protein
MVLITEELVPWRKVERWVCVRCGQCCNTLDVPVTFEEEDRLRRKYGNVFKRGKIGLYLKKKNGRCIFFKNGVCKIYDDRPIACRKYPFYFRSSGEDSALFEYNGLKIYVYVDKNCKGFGKGRSVEEVIKDILSQIKLTSTSS